MEQTQSIFSAFRSEQSAVERLTEQLSSVKVDYDRRLQEIEQLRQEVNLNEEDVFRLRQKLTSALERENTLRGLIAEEKNKQYTSFREINDAEAKLDELEEQRIMLICKHANDLQHQVSQQFTKRMARSRVREQCFRKSQPSHSLGITVSSSVSEYASQEVSFNGIPEKCDFPEPTAVVHEEKSALYESLTPPVTDHHPENLKEKNDDDVPYNSTNMVVSEENIAEECSDPMSVSPVPEELIL